MICVVLRCAMDPFTDLASVKLRISCTTVQCRLDVNSFKDYIQLYTGTEDVQIVRALNLGERRSRTDRTLCFMLVCFGLGTSDRHSIAIQCEMYCDLSLRAIYSSYRE